VSLLTEDRKRTGLCLNLPLATNITLANVGSLIRGFRLQNRFEIEVADRYIGKLNIRPPAPMKAVARLSGGNQQKSLLARWLFADSRIFLLDEPTRGVDVAARSEIYREINELAEAGAAILMVSSDLPELLGMSDRILVMRRGSLVAEFDARRTSQEEILKVAALEES
jgi:ABC-type sugar transport system ATPase subunit